jgi:hypothetical protein
MYDPIVVSWMKVCGGGSRESFTVSTLDSMVRWAH